MIYMRKKRKNVIIYTRRQTYVTMQVHDEYMELFPILKMTLYLHLDKKNADSDVDYKFSVNIMPYQENKSDLVNRPEYEYCYKENQIKAR